MVLPECVHFSIVKYESATADAHFSTVEYKSVRAGRVHFHRLKHKSVAARRHFSWLKWTQAGAGKIFQFFQIVSARELSDNSDEHTFAVVVSNSQTVVASRPLSNSQGAAKELRLARRERAAFQILTARGSCVLFPLQKSCVFVVFCGFAGKT